MFGFGHDAQVLALFQAIAVGDQNKAQQMLQADVSLCTSAAGKHLANKVPGVRLGATPLHAAAAAGQTPLVELLLTCKANIDAQTADGITPLHAAAQGGYFDAAALLLDHGADPKTTDGGQRTPLHAAASSGDERV